MVDTPSFRKQAREDIRRQILSLRRELTQSQQDTAAENLHSRLQSWSAFQPLVSTISQNQAPAHKLVVNKQTGSSQQPIRVGAYLAVGGEISLAPSLLWLQSIGVETTLPVIRHIDNHESLQFAPFTRKTPLRTARYGIPEPDIADDQLLPASELDIVLVPLVGFDRHGNRLGMGGGYYDRTFAFRRQSVVSNQIFAGVAHQFQQIERIPVESWDIPLDVIITDMAVHAANQR